MVADAATSTSPPERDLQHPSARMMLPASLPPPAAVTAFRNDFVPHTAVAIPSDGCDDCDPTAPPIMGDAVTSASEPK